MDRLDEIRQLLFTNKKVLVNDLSDHYQVSVVTIRKDLACLEKEGVAKRIYGGAVLSEDASPIVSYHADPILASLAEDQ